MTTLVTADNPKRPSTSPAQRLALALAVIDGHGVLTGHPPTRLALAAKGYAERGTDGAYRLTEAGWEEGRALAPLYPIRSTRKKTTYSADNPSRLITPLDSLRRIDPVKWERAIRQATDDADGDVLEAAEALAISSRQLYRILADERFQDVERRGLGGGRPPGAASSPAAPKAPRGPISPHRPKNPRRISPLGDMRRLDPPKWEATIRRTMEKNGGSVADAAADLEISRRQMERILADPRFADVERVGPGNPNLGTGSRIDFDSLDPHRGRRK